MGKLEQHADDALLAVLCACSSEDERDQAGITRQDRRLRWCRGESSRHGGTRAAEARAVDARVEYVRLECRLDSVSLALRAVR